LHLKLEIKDSLNSIFIIIYIYKVLFASSLRMIMAIIKHRFQLTQELALQVLAFVLKRISVLDDIIACEDRFVLYQYLRSGNF